MSQINPFTHVVIQSALVQRQMTVDKERQIRQAQERQKDIAAEDDALEHQVESSEEVQPVNDEAGKGNSRKKQRDPRPGHQDGASEEQPRLDMTA